MRGLFYVIGVLFAICVSPPSQAEKHSSKNQLETLEYLDDNDIPFFDYSGFVETRLGVRIQNDPNEKSASIGETRLQLETEAEFDQFTLNLVADFIYDPVMGTHEINLETGEGAIDLRQANVLFSPLSYVDVKVGRQILTWGTGDLVFINDLFAKDWNSFLIGRDDEYLKAPTDAIKSSLFFNILNIDLIYTPNFGADRYIDGKRISFFDRNLNSFRGKEDPLSVDRPNEWFENDELSLRLYRSIGAHEAALYYYNGYWKSPVGQNEVTGNATFPELDVFGASLRGPIAQGIGNIETGYYKSDGGAANNPLIRNSELQLLLGYEQEVATEFTAAIQYYLVRKLDYGKYISSLPNGAAQDDENRQVMTLRLTKLMMQQNLELVLFNFYSPSDKDGYLRSNTSYKISDTLKIEGGLNYFYGDKSHTFYAQFEKNNNVYTAVHYEF
jgi:hypothetical protein